MYSCTKKAIAIGHLAKLVVFWSILAFINGSSAKFSVFCVCQFLQSPVKGKSERIERKNNPQIPHPSKPCEFRALDERSYSRK